ncbi:bifunctional pyr operon transcriptional regulator/uracil phosphoribosyltransferase PyrR [Epidermidibacterium keratini]|uniref:Bifunctional protein PyrR n=1 Tax=Epidermidibacterium keratini TaxID=1891644 RepID=A0A7L4YHI0_9ACTN|nr:bifunctional pyr operon transcriptional regulator/uracil phosphoribosyltransferase PyrR [Epidermidibacterium keratini]QHB99024.1 bifunctional pyr operon transcriptional regulator/uracil phosphoribosyltransferase PyrR [Epidermidibacterium keratini]
MGSAPKSSGQAAPEGQRVILTPGDISRVIDRISHQILEKTDGGDSVVLVGIPTRGEHLATRVADRIGAFDGDRPPVGILDITLYRDDLRTRGVRPLERTHEPEGGIDDKTVILVDDVLYSGRTIRAALDALRDWGRPRAIQLAVLVDRGHRELPIRADYVGKNIPTSRDEQVFVAIDEYDGVDGVVISAQAPTRDQVIETLKEAAK